MEEERLSFQTEQETELRAKRQAIGARPSPRSVPTLQEIIENTADLPVLPIATLAVMRETDSATGSARSVANLICQDQGLAVRVLRLSNSAFYGLPRKVMDVPEAVVVLGMRAVKHLCLVASTYPWMSRPLAGYGLGPKDLWRHSFGVGVAAQMLACDAGIEPDQAFAAGLLHDIGKVALNVWMEARLPALIFAATQKSLTLEQAELEFFGFDHTQVGGLMAENWNLPKPMVEAIRHHHDPSVCPTAGDLVHCVHLADALCTRANIAPSLDGLPHHVDGDSMAKWQLDLKQLDELTEAFVAQYESQQKLFEGYEG